MKLLRVDSSPLEPSGIDQPAITCRRMMTQNVGNLYILRSLALEALSVDGLRYWVNELMSHSEKWDSADYTSSLRSEISIITKQLLDTHTKNLYGDDVLKVPGDILTKARPRAAMRSGFGWPQLGPPCSHIGLSESRRGSGAHTGKVNSQRAELTSTGLVLQCHVLQGMHEDFRACWLPQAGDALLHGHVQWLRHDDQASVTVTPVADAKICCRSGTLSQVHDRMRTDHCRRHREQVSSLS